MRYPLLAILLFAVLQTAQAEPPDGYPFQGYDAGMQLARQLHKKAFLYFGRYGCGYCGKTNIETFSDASLRKLYIKHYILIYVDAESGKRINLATGERITEMELGARLNVVGTPVFFYMEPDGDVILRAPGFKTVKDFLEMDRYIQSGHYRNQSINDFLKNNPQTP